MPGFLASPTEASTYLDTLEADAQGYAGFNLLLGDGEQLFYASNRAERFARTPDLADDALRIGKRRNHGMPTPESRPVAMCRCLSIAPAHGNASSPKTRWLARGIPGTIQGLSENLGRIRFDATHPIW